MENDNFANVSWQTDPPQGDIRSSAASPGADGHQSSGQRQSSGSGPTQMGHNVDGMDLAGVGEGIIECTVTSPLKENDGSKDAFISYLITTNVSFDLLFTVAILINCIDNIPFFSETHNFCPQTIHRLRIPLENTVTRIPSMRGPTTTG